MAAQQQSNNNEVFDSRFVQADYHLRGFGFKHDHKQQVKVAQIHLMQVNRICYEVSSFLDNRIYAPHKRDIRIDVNDELWDQLLKMVSQQISSPTHFIFHTAFCCSTWLSRLLQKPGHCLGLREPIVLRALAEVQRSQCTERSISASYWEALLKFTMHQLGKRYFPEEHVLIKPSNLCNGLIPDLLRLNPVSKAVIMTNSLQDFLISVLKKSAETKAKMPALAALTQKGLLPDADINAAATSEMLIRTHRCDYHLNELSELQAAAVLWQNQQDHINQVLNSDTNLSHRVHLLQADELLEQPVQVSADVNEFLGLNIPAAYFESSDFLNKIDHHAKAPQLDYSASTRSEENALIQRRYHHALASTVNWHEQHFQRQRKAPAA